MLGTFGILVLTLVVWVINRSPTIRWITWVLATPAFVLSSLSVLFIDPTLLMWSSLMEATLYFYAAGSLIAYMMEDYRVTTDELFAAGATFTLSRVGIRLCATGLPNMAPGQLCRRYIFRTTVEFPRASIHELQ